MMNQTSSDCNDDSGSCSTLYNDLQLLTDYSVTNLTGKLAYLAATNQSINVLTAFRSNGTVSNAIAELQRSVCRHGAPVTAPQPNVLPASYAGGYSLQLP